MNFPAHPAISLKDVSKSFDRGASFAVDGLSLDVLPGETLVLLGSSGSGKTTALKMINRLLEPSTGAVLVQGKDVAGCDPVLLRRGIGYVFQGVGLFPHQTVQENIECVPRLLGWPAARCRQRARELLELVGLQAQAHGWRYPDELSGGQRQRVGVARALAADPAIVLMDEPFGALDSLTRQTLQDEFHAWKRKLKTTAVFVTHDIAEALALGDRIAILHQGRLEQAGRPREILRRPASPFVRDLFARGRPRGGAAERGGRG